MSLSPPCVGILPILILSEIMGEDKDKDDGDNDDWVNTPEAEELRKQMANLERKISKFKQEIEEADKDR